MRVLLVDDEVLVREKLKHMISWNAFGYLEIEEAEDGETAWTKIERHAPDLLVSDIRMPFLDGLGLVEKVRNSGLGMDIILLSGYNEFDYVRKALRFQVKDYLLKPLDKEELEAVLRELGEKRESLSVQRFDLDRWIGRDIPFREEQELLLQNMQGISCERLLIGTGEIPLPPFLQRLTEDPDRQFKLLSSGNFWIVALGLHSNREAQQLLRRLNRGGWTTAENSERQLIDGCEKAASAYRFIRLWRDRQMAVWERLFLSRTDEKSPYTICRHWNQQAELLLRKGDREELRNFAGLICDDLKDSRLTVRDSKLAVTDFLLYISGQLPSSRQREVPHPEELFRDVSGTEAFQKRLEELLFSISSWFSEEGSHLSQQVLLARTFIKKNFSNPNLSLEVIAEQSFLNPAYFSTLFKRETGSTVVEYITLCRLEAARDLMLRGERDLSSIAEGVGYNDPYYLSKRFKKYFGKSPSEFLRSLR